MLLVIAWFVGDAARRGLRDPSAIGQLLMAVASIGAILAIAELAGAASGVPALEGLLLLTTMLSTVPFLAGLTLTTVGTVRELWAGGKRRDAITFGVLYAASLAILAWYVLRNS
jgi:hypothetical protein